ncbi:DUF4235 domain-containing protein [Nonomuraea zeae]|nr:DUF4235 domain-containing protein [Nonomuraea zeae]
MEKTLSTGMSLLSGALAAALFRRVWKRASGQDEAPEADDLGRGWTEVLVSATLQGAIFGLARAAVQRAGAQTFRRRAVLSRSKS